MSFLTYYGLKAIVSGIRLAQPCPVTAKPDEVLQIPSREDGRTIKANIYKPSTSITPTPVLLNFHGSGFILPWHGSDDVFCRLVSQKTQYTVLDIQYRLAPEHPFPAATNDVEDVIKYVLSHGTEYDVSHIALSGFSAGGTLALAAVSSPALPPNSIDSILVFYPAVDLSIDPAKKVQPDPSGPNVIPAMGARLFNACYISKDEEHNPMVSPAFMNVSKMPKNVLFVTCAYDTLAIEAETLGKKIEEEKGEGRNLVCKRIEGVSHAWDKSCKVGSEAEKKRDEAYALAVDMLNKVPKSES